MPNAFLLSLFQHKAWCNRGLIDALCAAPADADRRQFAIILFTLDHTAIVDQIFKAHLTGVQPGFVSVVAERMPDLQRLGKTMSETDAWYLDYAARASAADLETAVDFTFVADGDHGRMTKGDILAHIITHGASHRGAIAKMLETLNISGAPEMVTTFLRQCRPSMSSASDRNSATERPPNGAGIELSKSTVLAKASGGQNQ